MSKASLRPERTAGFLAAAQLMTQSISLLHPRASPPEHFRCGLVPVIRVLLSGFLALNDRFGETVLRCRNQR